MTAAFARAERSPHPGRLTPSDPPPHGEGEWPQAYLPWQCLYAHGKWISVASSVALLPQKSRVKNLSRSPLLLLWNHASIPSLRCEPRLCALLSQQCFAAPLKFGRIVGLRLELLGFYSSAVLIATGFSPVKIGNLSGGGDRVGGGGWQRQRKALANRKGIRRNG